MNINEFDSAITRIIQNWPGWWSPIMVAASFLADPEIIPLVAIGAMIAAYRMKQSRIMWSFAWTLPAMLLNAFVKQFLHRPRPDTLYVSKMPFHSFSFPSGHAFCATAVYGLVAYLALRHLPTPWNYIIAAGLVVLIILIGVSRVYLGAHFPTDVLGGWLFGLVVLATIILAIKP